MAIDKKFYQAVCELTQPFSARDIVEKTGFTYGTSVAQMKELVKIGMAKHVNKPPFTYRLIPQAHIENEDPQHFAAPNEIVRQKYIHHDNFYGPKEIPSNVRIVKH